MRAYHHTNSVTCRRTRSLTEYDIIQDETERLDEKKKDATIRRMTKIIVKII